MTMPIKERKVIDTNIIIPIVATGSIKKRLMKPKSKAINCMPRESGTIELNDNKSILIENDVLKKKFHLKSTTYVNHDEKVVLTLPA
jgi:hypothetical protein